MNLLGLVSKYPSMNGFPTYYEKSKGVMIDQYLDMSYMGLGSCMLGYADYDVNRAVIKCICDGNMATLNCYEEQEYAEMIKGGYDCVRYSRGGGDAMYQAYSIAMYHKKDAIVFKNGYHGWHLKNIGRHFDSIEELYTEKPDIVIIESAREEYPTDEWINAINDAKEKLGFILIVDEITSGFRFWITYNHKYKADMVVMGKAASNGYAFGVVIGKKEIMDIPHTELWISSTYNTERIGTVAALATLKKLLDKNVKDYIKDIGKYFIDNVRGLGVMCNNVPPLPHLFIQDKKAFCKYFMDNNILATDKFYPSYAHTRAHVDKYINVLKKYIYEKHQSELMIGG